MLTHVVRDALHHIANRFELVGVSCERCQQLLDGARPAVDNPTRERPSKVALREICDGKLVREGEGWRVDHPGLDDLFAEPEADDNASPATDEEE